MENNLIHDMYGRRYKERFIHTHYGYCFYDINAKYIYNLYVMPQYRRKGYAKKLLQYILNEFKEAGVTDEIYIHAAPKEDSITKEDLTKFYESLGLVVLATKPACNVPLRG